MILATTIIEGLSPGLLPLPKDVQHKLQTSSHLSAYTSVYNFQQQVLKDEAKVIRARVLGFMLLVAPSDTVRAEVVVSIVSCLNDTALYELGDKYMEFFIRPCECFTSQGSKTPASSNHPSRPSFDARRKVIKEQIHQAPENHQQAKDWALFRDGYRCVATKVFDANYSLQGYHEDYPDTTELQQYSAAATNCAHIIPASTYFKFSKDKKKDYAASVLAVLERFGYNINKLDGRNIHSMYNVMTLHGLVHDYFDQLRLWFETTDTPHRYEIKTLISYESTLRNVSPITTLTTPDPLIPLPDPKLLALHATCAKVAHLSGAGEYVDRVQRDFDRLDVLAEDGGSSDVLFHALYHSASIHVGA
ncbi:hypothetical protein BDP27DRAFT_1484480 [Rhodocollybia butyracea]|uniref:HNH nuclease domain-containing protein n=1 Tax=Rhodocollybia butyracea TaxID=206335 RepID=A0A9P5U1V9_9AGAR|nr:hypothetical protein BDP27DRAFT_1484480 [Rhodocollybia butyracea]